MIVDVNVNLSRWPFRRTPCDGLSRLVAKLCEHQVHEAWVGSLDGLFHRDVGGVNARLANACQATQQVRLVPFGTVNPMLPDWQEDLRRCAEDHRMPGIRLHPNYHGYRLDDALAAELFQRAAERFLIVQVVVRMDDVRVQHPLMQVADVDVRPLNDLVAACPTISVLLLNWQPAVRGAERTRLVAHPQIGFDIAMQEGVGGVANLLNEVPLQQVFFGSHLPLYPIESAWLKLHESDLDEPRRRAICCTNAHRKRN